MYYHFSYYHLGVMRWIRMAAEVLQAFRVLASCGDCPGGKLRKRRNALTHRDRISWYTAGFK